jgi:hypothetical protein
MRYIKGNNPQSAFAQHILNNQHEYGKIDEIMTLLKHTKHKPLLTPYEQYFIQTHYQQNKLITEQNPGKYNPLIQLAIDSTHVTQLKIITNPQTHMKAAVTTEQGWRKQPTQHHTVCTNSNNITHKTKRMKLLTTTKTTPNT